MLESESGCEVAGGLGSSFQLLARGPGLFGRASPSSRHSPGPTSRPARTSLLNRVAGLRSKA